MIDALQARQAAFGQDHVTAQRHLRQAHQRHADAAQHEAIHQPPACILIEPRPSQQRVGKRREQNDAPQLEERRPVITGGQGGDQRRHRQ